MNHKIDRFFKYLVENGGSDLHLSQGQPPKIRVHGSISAIPGEEVLSGETLGEMMREIDCDAIPVDAREPRAQGSNR